MYAALLLGLAGSLHCAGMCGPLVLALPGYGRRRALFDAVVYHSGRIGVYSLLGLAFGLFGKGLHLAGFQQITSIAAGGLMLFAAVFATRWERLSGLIGPANVYFRKGWQALGRLLQRHPLGGMFAAGMLNGLLPCGMVYLALAGAIATSEAWEGARFMALFGAGTAPLLLALSWAGHTLKATLRRRFRFVQPVLLAAAGLLLLSRGLHLDVSAFDSAVPGAQLDCH